MTDFNTNWQLWDFFHRLPLKNILKVSNTILEQIKHKNNKIKILDLGVGTGVITIPIYEYLNYHYEASVIGVDNNISKLNFLRPTLNDSQEVQLIFKDVEDDDFDGFFNENQFDVCFSIWFLHYIHEKDKLLKNLKKIIRNNGYFIYGKSKGDLLSLIGQEKNPDTYINDSRYNLFKILFSFFDNFDEIPTDLNTHIPFKEVGREVISWPVSLSVNDIILLYKERLIAKNFIDKLDEKHIDTLADNLLNSFGVDSEFHFLFELELIIYANCKSNR